MAKGGKAKEKPGRRQIGVKLDMDVWRDLKILALEKDRTAGELLEEAMREYLAKHRKGRK
jgi:hypothetical protein